MRVILLNLPGNKIYIRGYYCSQTSKADYFPHPIDFLMISAWLRDYDLHLVDAIRDNLDGATTIQKLKSLNPDAVIFLAGMVSWNEDKEFLQKLKKELDVMTIGVGDIFIEEGVKILIQNKAIDALLMDFCSEDIRHYLEGNYDKISNMIYRQGSEIINIELDKKYSSTFEFPIPRHDLFVGRGYRYPFVREKRYASVLTDYGCPFKCGFCVMGTLAYKYRPLENILVELDFLKDMKVREILFMDQSFGVLSERNYHLYNEMIKRKYNFGWVCFSRVDLVNYSILTMMKQAGCHTIIFGVESANSELLKKYNKGYTLEQIKDAFFLSKKTGIRTVGTFILGLPEDTKDSCYQTIDLAKKIKCDFASFNFAFPRFRTGLRTVMEKNKLFDKDLGFSDQSGGELATRSFFLTTDDLIKIRKDAFWQFYLRPQYILRQLLSVQTPYEMCLKFKNGLRIIRNLFKN